MLTGRAAIRPGQTVLILGANSGVGIAASRSLRCSTRASSPPPAMTARWQQPAELGRRLRHHHYQQKIRRVRKITHFEE